MVLKTTCAAAAAALTLAMPAWAEIEISDAYARSSNTMAGAAFMVITNTGPKDDRLIGVTSDAAQRVELHTHMEDDTGVMRMVHVEEGFDLPAGAEVLLQRGGKHVMFMGLTDPFEQGETLSVTFQFDRAGAVTAEIPVDQERMDHGTMDHGDMDHGDMDHGTMTHGTDG